MNDSERCAILEGNASCVFQAIPSFANGDEQRGGGGCSSVESVRTSGTPRARATAASKQLDLGGPGRSAFERDAPSQTREIAFIGDAEHARLVDPREAVPRVVFDAANSVVHNVTPVPAPAVARRDGEDEVRRVKIGALRFPCYAAAERTGRIICSAVSFAPGF